MGFGTSQNVSPYNGLASESFSPPSLVFTHFQSDSGPPGRTQSLSFGCSALCSGLEVSNLRPGIRFLPPLHESLGWWPYD
jgi:hypothetical protein